MRKANLIFAVFVLTFFGVFSCSVNGQTPSNTKSKSTNTQKQRAVKFVFKKTGEDKDEISISNIYLFVDGKKNLVDAVKGGVYPIEGNLKEIYAGIIPKNAVAACLITSAGLAEYYYAVKSKNGFNIFYGSMDEGREEEDYYWKKIKTIIVR